MSTTVCDLVTDLWWYSVHLKKLFCFHISTLICHDSKFTKSDYIYWASNYDIQCPVGTWVYLSNIGKYLSNGKEKRDPSILDPTIAITCKYNLLRS